MVLRGDELQLARGESVRDTALVLSRYVDANVIGSGSHENVAELARHATVPVINALTPEHHPCQALADLLTLRERFGSTEGCGRVRRRWQQRRPVDRDPGGTAGVELVVAGAGGLPARGRVSASSRRTTRRRPRRGADALYTDVWVSMGDEAEAESGARDLGPLPGQRGAARAAAERAIVMHCLPAHPGRGDHR